MREVASIVAGGAQVNERYGRLFEAADMERFAQRLTAEARDLESSAPPVTLS
jgi:hypothetical protein